MSGMLLSLQMFNYNTSKSICQKLFFGIDPEIILVPEEPKIFVNY